ncbi:unnamed protein product [Mucor hiemalis]
MMGNKDDNYGIVTLSNEATWWYNCDGNADRLKDELSFLDSQVTQHYDHLYTKSIFKAIADNVIIEDDDRITQAIVFYARSDIVPLNISRDKYKSVRDSPNFTMDVIFMHNQTDDIQKVYDTWNELDSTVNEGWYYAFGQTLCKDRFARAITQLLAHPLQRGSQDNSAMHRIIL